MLHDHITAPEFALLEIESWRPIPGWPGYEVSDLGRVQSYLTFNRYSNKLSLTPRILKVATNTHGRQFVGLYRAGRKGGHPKLIHCLVLEAFVSPRPSGKVACHNDGDKTNNRLSNLRWDTHSGNCRDMFKHGTHSKASLSLGDVVDIWKRLVSGEACPSIARDYGVKSYTISTIRVGKTYSHITRELNGWPLVSRKTLDPILPSPDLAHTEIELWRLLPEWPAYRVSNRGRVMTCIGRARGEGTFKRGANWVMTDTWVPLVPVVQKNGGHHTFVAAGRTCGHDRNRMFFIHTAVMTAFVCPRPTGMVCCHADGNPANNRLDNLRWDTQLANVHDHIRRVKALETAQAS